MLDMNKILFLSIGNRTRKSINFLESTHTIVDMLELQVFAFFSNFKENINRSTLLIYVHEYDLLQIVTYSHFFRLRECRHFRKTYYMHRYNVRKGFQRVRHKHYFYRLIRICSQLSMRVVVGKFFHLHNLSMKKIIILPSIL